MGLKKEVLDMKKEVEEVKEQSDLHRILKMEDNKNKRLCFIIGLLVILFALSICYIIYLKNDIGTEVTTNGHITAIIDGVIYDTFNPSNRIMRCAWKID